MPSLYIEPDQRKIDVPSDTTILAGAIQSGIPIAHACGGNARCSTCRVYVLEGLDNLSPPEAAETRLLTEMKFPSCVRLSCQSQIRGDVSIQRATIEELDETLFKVERPNAATISQLGKEKNIAALFADIVSYTPFAARIPPYDVMYILNKYFQMMSQIVEYHWGYIIDYYGDGFLACFEQESDDRAYALNAVRAGQAMFEALEVFNESLRANYQHTFSIRVGIHSGNAIVGTIGAGNVTKKTIIGDSVNLASRIEQANKALGTSLLVCQATYEAVKDQIAIKHHYQVSLSGKKGLYQVHGVVL